MYEEEYKSNAKKIILSFCVGILIFVLLVVAFGGFLEEEKSEKKIKTLEDKTSPEIKIINPKEGELLEGKVKIKVMVEDESEVRISFYIDEKLKQNDYKMYYNWNTALEEDGEHEIKVIAIDTSGNEGRDSINVKTDNTPNKLPNIKIIKPLGGEVIKGRVKIEGTASDDVEIIKVELKIGNEWNLADTSSQWSEWSYEWETENEGGYEIIARAIDNEGGISECELYVYVDNLPPILEIKNPENNEVLNGEIEIETDFNDFSEVEKIDIYIDNNLIYEGVEKTFKLNSLEYEDGRHEIKVIAKDIVGNWESRSIDIEIDNTPPSLTIINPKEGDFVKGIVNIEAKAYDNNDLEDLEFYIDNEFVGKGKDYELDTRIYSDGEHEIKVVAIDALGNKKEAKISVNIDNTPPTIEIKEPTPQSWVNEVIKIVANVSDSGFGIEYVSFFVDNNIKQNGTSSIYTWNTKQYSKGEHEIKIISADKSGNINKLSFVLNIDNIPPIFYISSPKNNEFVKDITIIEVANIYDNESGADFANSISFYFDSELINKAMPGFNNKASFELDTKKYVDGEHEISIEVIDRLGNKKDKSISIKIDNTNPYVDIISLKEGEIVSKEVKIEVNANDEGSGMDYVAFYIDNIIKSMQSGGNYIFDWNTLKYGDGEHKIEVIAFDNVGNYKEEEVNVTVDNTPPEIEIIKPRANSKVHDIVTIEVKVNDASEIDYIEFLIDSNSVQKGKKESFEWNTTDYEEEKHEIKIIAEDKLGNKNQKSINVTVDNLNPMHVDITSPHQNEATHGKIKIKAEVETGEGADVEYITFYIDGEAKQNSTQTTYLWNTESASNGMHKIRVEGGDTHGNINYDEIEVMVDNKKPSIEIKNPNDNDIVSEQIQIEINADDEHSGIKYIDFQIDGVSLQNDTLKIYDLDTTSYEDGEHEIKVLISDKAENMNQDEITITIDNTPPKVKITHPSKEWVRGTVKIKVDIVENGSGIDYIEFKIENESKQNSTKESYSWDTKKYDDGTGYNIEIKAVDKAKNSNKTTKIVGIDNTPPNLDITSPTTSNPYVRAVFRIETTASDTGSGLDNLSFSIDDSEKQKSKKQWYDWNTTVYSDGWHEIKVIVWDIVENNKTKEIDAYVDNTLPTIEITYPENNAELEENADEHISADADDYESGIEKVEFYIDEILKFEDMQKPFRYNFNTGDYTNGWHDIDVFSYDKAGNRKGQRIRVKIGEVEEPIIKDPHTNFLGNGYNVGNAERINVNDYTQIPIISSLVKRGITPSLGWDGSQNQKTTFNVPSGDQISKYSGKMALAFWNTPNKAIVVDNYEHALLMSQYAGVKDYPIIVYKGNKQITDEALYKLNTVWANQIIVCGNTPYNNQGVTVVNENDVQQFTIDAAKFEGIDLEYITVINPNDSTANTAYLSSFGGVFASFHNGILIECSANGNEINIKVHNAIDLLENNDMSANYICIVGDHISLPFIYEGGTPSDNRYADLDGDKYTIEVSIGRVFGKELKDMSYYIDRVVNYQDYLDQSPIRLQRFLDPFGWRNNAVIYMGIAAEFAEDSENHCREFLWAQGQFNTQDDTGEAHMVNTPKLMADFAMSNFIIINADHGMPTGTVTFSSSDLQDLHPGICFGVSCSVGRIDGVNKQNSLTYTFLEKGINAWLAPTRTAYGSFMQTYPYQPIAAPGLCYLYLREILANDLTSGEAMKNAKNRLIAEGVGGNIDKVTTWQYQHYGDPAFNPYEPNHEGMP